MRLDLTAEERDMIVEALEHYEQICSMAECYREAHAVVELAAKLNALGVSAQAYQG